jgi:peptide/nickel transport system substrate-binding protein
MTGNYDMALMSRGYLTDVPEPIGFLSADYSCEGGFNISQFCDAKIDAMLTAAAAEEDDANRYTAYGKLAQHFYDQAVTVYLVNETVFDAASNIVVGYKPHPLNYYVFDANLDLK